MRIQFIPFHIVLVREERLVVGPLGVEVVVVEWLYIV